MDRYMTMKEVGPLLRITAQSVRRLIAKGRLAAHKIGPCSFRISPDAVDDLLTQTQCDDGTDAAEEQKKEKVAQ